MPSTGKTYRIKPLKWTMSSIGGDIEWSAYGINTEYTVTQIAGEVKWIVAVCGGEGFRNVGEHDTLEAAKSAAQAHWESTLAGVLEPVEE